MKRFLIFFLILTGTSFIKAGGQNIDPFLEGAIITANATENADYNNIKDNQTAIQKAQEATILVVDQVNQIQNKIYQGLMHVSSLLKNAYQIKECLQALNDIFSYESDMLAEAQQNPLALAFALKIQNEMANKAIAYYANISAVVLKANTKDLLMDAGERSTLLYKIQLDLNTLRAMAAYSYYKVHLAVMQGIINSFNPFKGYVDIDGKIVKDLLANWKH
ncbi:MAG: hypothetical protein KGM16_17005 [Bacteroidota bacterium]|nr:hypothetical protein [Bacteroidota bacterium]